MTDQQKNCPKCESRHWMTGLLALPGTGVHVCVSWSEWVGAKAGTRVTASMCADCGYTELYAADPRIIWDEWSKQNR